MLATENVVSAAPLKNFDEASLLFAWITFEMMAFINWLHQQISEKSNHQQTSHRVHRCIV